MHWRARPVPIFRNFSPKFGRAQRQGVVAEKSCLIWRRRAWSVTCETHDRYVLTKALIRVFTLHALTALLQLAQRVDSASMASWGVEKRSRFFVFVDMLKPLFTAR